MYLPSSINLNTQIYEASSDSIVIKPFRLPVNPTELKLLLALPDRDLLAVSSTSPETEDPRFVPDVRAVYSFVLEHAGENGRGWLERVFGGGDGKPIKALVFPRGAGDSGGGEQGQGKGT